jgi:hypothetical protein
MSKTFVTFAREELIARVAMAEERVWLASPFLTAPIAARIADAAAEAKGGVLRLLTALVPRSVQAGVLSTTGLSVLLEAGFEIASIPNLHAKVSLVDSDWGLVGSGNLTGTGLGGEEGGNLELGVRLSSGQRAEAAELFADWWEAADPVTPDLIAAFAALPEFSSSHEQPPPVGEPLGLVGDPGLEEVLAEDAATAAGRSYWIKSNYHRPDDAQWWHRNWISDWRQGPYEIGDLIVLYLSARDGGPACCPAVVEVTATSRHDPEWVRSHRDVGAADRWPYVTETAVVGEVLPEAGAKLSVIAKNGQSVQGGYCSISRGEFELMVRAMLGATHVSG